MDVLRPAMASPSSMNGKLLLINNIVPQPENVGQYYMGLNKEGSDTSYTISCSVDSFVDLLQGYITARVKTEGVVSSVETVSLLNNRIGKKRGSTAYFKIDSLDNKQRSQLRNLSNAALWASLDGLLVESLESCGQQDNVFPQMRIVFVRTFWRVYDATSDSLLLAFKRRDSLVWKTEGSAPGVAERPLPTLKETLPEITDFVAGEVYRALTPYWEPVERFYYVTGNVQLELAGDEVKAGRWDEAAVYWEQAYEHARALNAFKAAVNLMLYHEKDGDVPGAITWAERANDAGKRSFFPPVEYEWQAFKAWEKALHLRLEEMGRLNRYIGGIVK